MLAILNTKRTKIYSSTQSRTSHFQWMPPRPIHGAILFLYNKLMPYGKIFYPANWKTQHSFGMSIVHTSKYLSVSNLPIDIRSRCQKIRIRSFTELNCLASWAGFKNSLLVLNGQSIKNHHHCDKEGRSQQVIS